MELEEVVSSNITHIGYDRETKTLVIKFKKGNTYKYYPVEPKIHKALMAAESHGQYFATNIKNNKEVNYERID